VPRESSEIHGRYFVGSWFRVQDIYQQWLALTTLAEQRASKLDEAEQKQQHVDQLRLQFAKQAPVRV
jgi:hypothetical protein